MMTNNDKRGELTRRYYMRMDEDMWDRLKEQQEKETKRNMYPVSISHIVRKCIRIGLERMEGQK